MSRLTVENGAEAGIVYPMQGDAVTLGRSATSTIQVVDKRVSRHHAVLRRHRDSYAAEDLGSKNGSFINGQPLVGKVKLMHGDHIQLGDTVLVFELDPEEELEDPSGQQHPVKLVTENIGTQQQSKPVEADTAPSIEAQGIDRGSFADPIKRLKVIYQVADNIRSELELNELLNKIMDILWNVSHPHRGIILLYDEERHLEPVVVRTASDAAGEINVSRGIVERSLAEKVAILVSDAPSDLRFSANDSIVFGKIRSAICAPLVCKGEALGVIYIDSQDPGHNYYTNDELDLVTGIANQAAMAIVNARLHRQAIERQKVEKELEIARKIQTNLLPAHPPDLAGVDIAALSVPARQVGGDYYDFLGLPDGNTIFAIADVSGKGVPAAILATSIRASLRVEAMERGHLPVSELVASLNHYTCRDASNNMFATMFLGVYHPEKRTLQYTNAGHCFPILVRANGQIETLDVGGCFLGIMEHIEYEQDHVQLEAGDMLVIYTDGVTDAQNPQQQLFGGDRLLEIITANTDHNAADIRDKIHNATNTFRGNAEPFDDLTLIIAKF